MQRKGILLVMGLGCWLASGCAGTLTPAAQPRGGDAAARVIDRIRVGFNPMCVAVSGDGRWVYAVNSQSNSVSKIEAASRRVVSTLTVGDSPAWLALTPDGRRACVTARAEKTLSVVDLQGNYIVTDIKLDSSPEQVVVHPQGRWAYVSMGNAPWLSLVDLERQRVAQNISLNGESIGVALTPDKKFLYVTNRDYRYNLIVLSTADQSVAARASAGSAPGSIAMDPAGVYAYIANMESNDITVVHVPTHHPVLNVPVGKGPVGLAVTPDSRYVYVTCRLDNALYIVDANSYQVLQRLDLEVTPWGIAMAPDGSAAYVANYDSKNVEGATDDLARPQLALGTAAAQRVNNNNIMVIDTGKYR